MAEVRAVLSVGEVARLAGVSVRTLHHWEAVGLLVPSARTASGYRQYDDGDLDRLHRVLVYRELDLPLDEVRSLLDGEVDALDTLRAQQELLRARIDRLQRVAAAVDRAVEARRMGINLDPHEVLEVFGDDDPTEHAAEAEQRWGDTDAWKESQRRTSSYDKQDWLRIKAEQDDLERRLVEAFRSGVPAASDAGCALAEEHRQLICRWFYDCPPKLHRCIGEMYVGDDRFRAHYDALAVGLVEWVREAWVANAERQGG